LSGEREEVEKLLKIRHRIEKRIGRLKVELEYLSHFLTLLDKEISAKSFKPAATLKPSTPTIKPIEAPPTTPSQTVPLRASDGVLLATMHVSDNEIKVLPSEELKFNVNTPPFRQFLVSKVLDGMVSKDKDAAAQGQITPDEILTYKIIQDEDLIREIIIRNYREERRIVTLKNALRWTLEKMYEKTKI
jgi:hypothetical protein